MSWVLFAVGVVLLTVAFADRIPVLNKLPPPLGAVKPPTVEFHVEGRGDLRFEMQEIPHDVILAVGMSHRNRHKIAADINAHLVGSDDIARCGQDGAPWETNGKTLRADGPYWSETDLKTGTSCGSGSRYRTPAGTRSFLCSIHPDFYETDGIELQRPSDMLCAVRLADEHAPA
jgi:hypothetical protein